MKIKKPEIIPMFKCSSGPPVESLSLWKRSELDSKIAKKLPQLVDAARSSIIDMLLEDSQSIIEILWLKEKGRPRGVKDSVTPRKKRTAEAAAAKAA